jgi:pimeloyl-ACP methyl ester carboxylesterase
MKRIYVVMYVLMMGLGMPVYGLNLEPEKADRGVVGIWQGSLHVSGIELRLVVKITQKPDKTLTATMDSIDQGAKDIPMDSVTLKGDALRLELKAIGGVYEGKLNKDGSEIEGTWSQGGGSLPLTLKRTDKAPELRRPQEPKPPYPYGAEEVSYPNPKAGNTLAGTLTLPKGAGLFPVVLMITGSGPQNRDEELLGHKPFWIIADYLTRRGVAVLRVDDRGVGKSTGKFDNATSADFATDVLAGIAYLKTRKEIDPKQIGLIGHSEGGLIAPMVAAKSPDVAFIVMMAGPGVTGEEILYEQAALIQKASGAPESAVAWNRKLQHQLFAIVKSEPDSAAAEKQLDTAMDAAAKQMTAAEKKQLGGDVGAALQAQVKSVNSPWFRYFLTYDPRPALRKVRCPVLAINGERDLQVPPKQNLPEIEAALKAGGNTDYTIKELPQLNHLFQTATSGSPAEYSKIEETVSPLALETMADWIVKHTSAGK